MEGEEDQLAPGCKEVPPARTWRWHVKAKQHVPWGLNICQPNLLHGHTSFMVLIFSVNRRVEQPSCPAQPDRQQLVSVLSHYQHVPLSSTSTCYFPSQRLPAGKLYHLSFLRSWFPWFSLKTGGFGSCKQSAFRESFELLHQFCQSFFAEAEHLTLLLVRL